MSTVTRPAAHSKGHPREAEKVSFLSVANSMRRGEFLEFLTRRVDETDGAILRLNVGYRAYVVTRPDHVRHVLLTNAENYPREGLMWEPMQRLVGRNIGGDGPQHREAKRELQPSFTAGHIAKVYDQWARVVCEAVGDLTTQKANQVVNAYEEYTRIIHRAVNNIFFGAKISLDDSELVGDAVRDATTSLVPRLLAPWLPYWVPVPGELRFRRAVKTVDRVMKPLVDLAVQGNPDVGIASSLAARGADAQHIRDELVAIAVAGSESTAIALSWLAVVFDEHPEIADRVHAELNEKLGEEIPTYHQLHDLTYTKMVLKELIRMYPAGWILPRTAQQDDVIDGVKIKGGSYVIISPYLTHRLSHVWEDPQTFKPERFTPEREKERKEKFAGGLPDLSFGYGAHSCLGQQFFEIEALLIVSRICRTHRLRLHNPPGASPVRAKPGLALNPKRDVGWLRRRSDAAEVQIILEPRG